MIRLQKGDKPEILKNRAAEWTATIVDKIARGETPTQAEKTRYRRPEIKDALVAETSGKCAYCESKLLHIHHGDVEHIFPKSLDPKKTFEWENLTLACEICNQNKSALDPHIEFIVDPYNREPSDHLIFIGSLVYSRGTNFGTSTRSILDLNRAELAERREEHLERLMAIYENLLRADVPLVAKKAIYGDLKNRVAGPAAAYTAMARALIDQMRPQIPEELEQ
jgi:5-methylcytosine-specific restriction endonuclease McrA